MSKTVVKAYQSLRGLQVDGVAGPVTLSDARSVLDSSRLMPEDIPVGVSFLQDGVNGTEYQRMVWAWANWFAEAGASEIGGNNSGPWVAEFHNIEDDGDPDNDGAWCASFQAECFERAARQLGLEQPPLTYSRRQRGGAQALFRRVAAGGSRVAPEDLEHMQLYVICWKRGNLSWQGHIESGFYDKSRDDFVTIGANVGSYSRVAGRVRRFRHEDWKNRLHGVALLGC